MDVSVFFINSFTFPVKLWKETMQRFSTAPRRRNCHVTQRFRLLRMTIRRMWFPKRISSIQFIPIQFESNQIELDVVGALTKATLPLVVLFLFMQMIMHMTVQMAMQMNWSRHSIWHQVCTKDHVIKATFLCWLILLFSTSSWFMTIFDQLSTTIYYLVAFLVVVNSWKWL